MVLKARLAPYQGAQAGLAFRSVTFTEVRQKVAGPPFKGGSPLGSEPLQLVVTVPWYMAASHLDPPQAVKS